MDKLAILNKCTVEGNVVKLPDIQLERDTYLEVKKSLELIGGKWKGGKVYGFVFQQDPTELLEAIASGDKRNLKKEFQFFATPSQLADELVALADIQEQHSILEPSAGQGAIIQAISRFNSNIAKVDCFELMDLNRQILSKIPKANILDDDFLLADIEQQYDRIIANPPFTKNQDIIHIRKMYDCLKPGGRLVTVSSKHWSFADDSKPKEFRSWLESLDHQVITNEPGVFKESGTSIPTLTIIINK